MTPQEAFARSQSGFAAYRDHRFVDAESVADAVLAALPKDPNGLYLKAICRRARQDPAAALLWIKQACDAAPGQLGFELAAAQILGDLQEFAAARSRFEAIATAFPDAADPHLMRGLMERQANDLDAARQAYERALELRAGDVEAHRGLAWVCENQRDWAGARTHADAVLAVEPSDPVALSARAGADMAAGKPDAARELIGAHFDAGRSTATHNASVWRRLGDACEALGDHPAALDAWVTGYGALREHLAPGGQFLDEMHGLDSLKRLKTAYDELSPPKSAPDSTSRSPVFLVGFPRSGTTLLEQILASHSAISSSDEAALLQPLLDEAGDSPDSLRHFLADLPRNRARLQSEYWQRVDRLAVPGSQVFIDKLPLNLPWLGLIGQVFPNARIILALRDPRDAIVSTFKRLFRLNTAMLRTYTLADTVALYGATMAAADAGRRIAPDLRVTDVRYEDLVIDMKDEIARVLLALDLEWESEMADYRERLSPSLSTPSAAQVEQAIHDRAVGAWRHHASALAPYESQISPWLQRWNYRP
ncbi:tetratricopeptide repeat-containing sulfotransferase family protein [Maricaulis sp.]|uniref:tetratricopeptide repeat-containing sulfotransferase family protein n=1 Tax=Maricaulis sp. TaxID=1486257 RepID=UPI002B2694E2|nr:sulfotransferase [Maricaulis sp.]